MLTSQQALVHALGRQDLFSSSSDVEVYETHISYVFVGPRFAVKVKKDTRLPFLDYGTLDRRREMCLAEVAVNARWNQCTYLFAAGLRWGERGDLVLTHVDDSEVCEFGVVMNRYEQGATLRSRARAGTAYRDLGDVGRRLAELHAASGEAPPEARSVAWLRHLFRENLDELTAAAAGYVDADLLTDIGRTADTFFSRNGRLIARRVEEHDAVRDVHGDIRLDHIVRIAGREELVDRLEFRPDLRLLDVADDLALLVMELLYEGHGDLVDPLVAAYRSHGGDPGGPGYLDFWVAHRALVWSKIRFFGHAVSQETSDLEAAHRFLALAVDGLRSSQIGEPLTSRPKVYA